MTYTLFPAAASKASPAGQENNSELMLHTSLVDAARPNERHTPETPDDFSHLFKTEPSKEVKRESAATLVEAVEASEDTSALANDPESCRAQKKAPPASIAVDEPPPAMRSMFPTFDGERGLKEQYYFPSQMSPSHLPYESVVKSPFSEVFAADVKDVEKAGLIFKPVGDEDDGFTPEWELPSMWATGEGGIDKILPQHYRLRMRQAPNSKGKRQSKWRKSRLPMPNPVLTFGSASAPFLSVKARPSVRSYCIERHRLNRFQSDATATTDLGDLLGDFRLKTCSSEGSQGFVPPELELGIQVITSFIPRNTVLDTPALTLFEEDESSQGDETEEKDGNERHRCYIVLRTYPGQRHPSYALKHPTLGFLRLKTSGDVRLPQQDTAAASRLPEVGKVELLAPIKEDCLEEDSDSLYAVTTHHNEPEIVLASIDLAQSTLLVDGTALADVNETYLVDTAITSLIAVILAETSNPQLSQKLDFAPPPTTALVPRRGKTILMRSLKPKQKSKKEKAEDEMEQTLSTVFGMLAIALGMAVDKLGAWNEKVEEKEKA